MSLWGGSSSEDGNIDSLTGSQELGESRSSNSSDEKASGIDHEYARSVYSKGIAEVRS